jgi:hypothetical protein
LFKTKEKFNKIIKTINILKAIVIEKEFFNVLKIYVEEIFDKKL